MGLYAVAWPGTRRRARDPGAGLPGRGPNQLRRQAHLGAERLDAAHGHGPGPGWGWWPRASRRAARSPPPRRSDTPAAAPRRAAPPGARPVRRCAGPAGSPSRGSARPRWRGRWPPDGSGAVAAPRGNRPARTASFGGPAAGHLSDQELVDHRRQDCRHRCGCPDRHARRLLRAHVTRGAQGQAGPGELGCPRPVLTALAIRSRRRSGGPARTGCSRA
jgi:hypothetical protein